MWPYILEKSLVLFTGYMYQTITKKAGGRGGDSQYMKSSITYLMNGDLINLNSFILTTFLREEMNKYGLLSIFIIEILRKISTYFQNSTN